MNEQAPEARLTKATAEVHSIFRTIQGEGPFSGVPAVFVRLAGCNLQCPWCDTEYTNQRTNMSSDELITAIAAVRQNEDLLVITGGEPFRQAAVTEVIEAGLDLGMYVQIETNGTLPPPKRSIPWATGNPSDKLGVYLVVSPKMNHVNADIERVAHAYKYVLTDGEVDPTDGLPNSVLGHPTKNVVARPPKRFHGPIYVQPADEKNIARNNLNLQATIESAQAFGYTLQLQLHKYLGME